MLLRLAILLADVGDRLRYLYDFGDDWEHDITLSRSFPLVPK